jgi:thiol-disulfide isomerase/thioredoxin
MLSERVQRTRRFVVAGVIVSIVAVSWWQVDNLRSGASDGVNGNAGSGLTLFPGPQGVHLPRVEGRTLDGQKLALSELRGHVVVLNVWGSWCAPCRAEAPDLARISAETASRGVRFVGIDVRDNAAAAQAFLRHYGITYPSFDDQGGLVLVQFTGLVPVGAVPSTIVVDKQGIVRARAVGRIDATTLRGLIDDAEAGS